MLVSHADDNAGTRRDFLYYATAGAGVVTAGAAVWPLVNQMNPSADVQALSSIFVDIGGVEEGQQLTVNFLGKPVFIRRRTPEEIEDARAVDIAELTIDRQSRNPNRPGTDASRREPHPGRGGRMAGHVRRVHPPGLRAAGQWRGRFQRLVLPLPRLALRCLWPHPPRACAREPAYPGRSAVDDTDHPAWLREITMAGIPHDHYEPKSNAEKWLHRRLPIVGLLYDTIMLPTPKNLNWMWIWGIVLMFCLVLQIVTGIVLVMHYTPHADMAFASVEHIMRNVNGGHMLRYLHQNGAMLFFAAVYIHIFRGLYYGSYKSPREVTWIIGMLIYLLMMATAFMGYVLPWGQMSFWGATVITGLFGAIPGIGEPLQTWLLGGPAVGNATLTRFFSLHYLLPFVILGLSILHIWAFHTTGNNNPTGVEVRRTSKEEAEKDTLPFWPYFVIKDLFALAVVLLVFWIIVAFMPNFLGHPTTTSRRTRWLRRRTSCPNGTSCRSTRSCAPSPPMSGW
jgi:hypothetical protein